MDDLMDSLFRGDYMPHGHCYWWKPDILWLNVGADLLIALAYFTIPFALYFFVRKRTDLRFKGIFLLFSLFIALCGLTHLFSIVVIWKGYYGIHGLLKLMTAVVSCVTAYKVFTSLPHALAIPGPKEVAQALEQANQEKLERIKLEHARKQEIILRESTDSAHVGILVVDHRSVILVANRAVCDIFGYTKLQLEGQPVDILIDPQLKSQHDTHMSRFFASDSLSKTMAINRVVHGISRTGQRIPIEVKLNKQHYKGETVVYVSLQDISRRVEAEKALLQSEEMMRSIFDSIPLGIHIFELRDERLFLSGDNPSAKELLHPLALPEAKAEQADLRSQFPAVTDDETYHRFTQVALEGTPMTNETVTLQGHAFLINAFQSTPGKVIVLFDDITEKRRADTLLREHQDMVRKAINASVAGVFIYDRFERSHLYINERFTHITGYTNADLTGCKDISMLTLVHPEDRSAVYGHIRQLLRLQNQHKMLELEYRIRHKDGHWIWLLSRDGIFEFADNAQVSRIIGSFLDITPIKAMQENLVTLKNRAEQASQSRADFLANMSHEIRTPLNAIIALTRLTSDMPLAEKPREYMTRVHESAQSLLAILNDILDYSRLEADKVDVTEVPFDLSLTLRSLLSLFSVSASEKHLAFHADIPPALGQYFIGDATKLTQILNNLVGNAIKFTRHGAVTLSITAENGTSTDDVILTFCIADTGPGIEKDKLESLFEPFTQADSSIGRKYGGSGLGLAICRKLATRLHGHVSASSKPGKGSTFSLTLPLKRDAGNCPARLPDYSGVTFTIVGDESFSAFLMHRFLNACKATIATLPDRKQITPSLVTDYLIIDITTMNETMQSIESQLNAIPSLTDAVSKGVLIMADESIYRHARMPQHHELPVAWLVPPFLPLDIENAIDTLSIPATRQPAIEQPNLQFAPCLALLVEDNEANQYVATELLSKLGISVNIAQNGEDALAMVDAVSYDIVLMDLQMPGMDGYTTSERIRRHHDAKTLPIVILSAAVSDADEQRMVDCDIQDFVTKPIDISTLTRVLQKVLPQHCYEVSPEDQLTVTPAKPSWLSQLPSLNTDEALARLQYQTTIYENLLRNFVSTYSAEESSQQFPPTKVEESRALHTLKGLASSIGAENLAIMALRQEEGEFVMEEITQLLSTTLKEIRTALNDAPSDRPQKPTLSFETLTHRVAQRTYISQSEVDACLQMLEAKLGVSASREVQQALYELRYDDALMWLGRAAP